MMQRRLPLFAESPRTRAVRALRDDPSFGQFIVLHSDAWVQAACRLIDSEYADPETCSLNDFYDFWIHRCDELHLRGGSDDEYFECRSEWVCAFNDIFTQGVKWIHARLDEPLEEPHWSLCDEEYWSQIFNHMCGVFIPDSSVSFDLPPKAGKLPFKLFELKPPAGSGVYYIQIGRRVKIGQSRNIASRLRALATSAPELPRLVGYEINSEAKTREQDLHRQWQKFRKHGEWFEIEGELLDYIVTINNRLIGGV